MALYQLAIRTTVTTSGAACAELRSAAKRVKVVSIKLCLAAATASQYGIGRPQAIGVTPTSPVTVLPLDPADTGQTATTAVAWGTGPTVPLQFLDRTDIAAAIGNGVILTFAGLVIPVNASLVVWNLAANSAATDITFTVDE